MKMKRIIAREYFNPPLFDWFHKWCGVKIQRFDIYRSGDVAPHKFTTEVIWKSRKTGRVKKKEYDYQISWKV